MHPAHFPSPSRDSPRACPLQAPVARSRDYPWVVFRSVNQEPCRAVVERRGELSACGLNIHDMKTTDELLDETRAELATMRVVVDGEDYTITGVDNPERLLLRTALEYQPRYGYYAETPTRDAITSTTLRLQDGGGNPHTLRVVYCVEDKTQHAYMDAE